MVPGNTCWKAEKWERKGKKPLVYVIISVLPLWAPGDQSHWATLENGDEYVPELSHWWDEEAGIFLHQLPIYHCLKAAFRGIKSPAFPSFPEWVPAKGVAVESYRWLQLAALGVKKEEDMFRVQIGSVTGAYNHREGIHVCPREILQSQVQGGK